MLVIKELECFIQITATVFIFIFAFIFSTVFVRKKYQEISINQNLIQCSYNNKQMFFPTDQELQALLVERAFKAPTLQCGSGHKIVRFCNNEACNFDALCCNQEQCQNCQILHEKCCFYKLKQLNRQVEDRFFLHKKILQQLFRIEKELIDKLLGNRREIIEKSKAWRFGGSEIVESIYFKNISKGFKGKQMKEVFASLTDKSKKEIEAEKYLQSYKVEGDKMVANLEKLKKDLVQNLREVNSDILANDHQKYQSLMKQLGNSSSLKLLFRASQHNFAASKFHECCDGISNTVTIVRTEFGKTIAAYTPLQWSSVQGHVADDSSRSFLLQLELKQKMTLTQPQNAIHNNKYWGPTFGWNDLCIADKSNQNQHSFSNFPTSYNCNGKYKNNQENYTAFCGSPNGCQFRIAEWQVFVVVK